MNPRLQSFLLNLLLIIISAALGWFLFPLAVNLLIVANILGTALVQDGGGYDIARSAVLVWLTAVAASLPSFFFQKKSGIRWLLLSLPIIMPLIFLIIYTLRV